MSAGLVLFRLLPLLFDFVADFSFCMGVGVSGALMAAGGGGADATAPPASEREVLPDERDVLALLLDVRSVDAALEVALPAAFMAATAVVWLVLCSLSGETPVRPLLNKLGFGLFLVGVLEPSPRVL